MCGLAGYLQLNPSPQSESEMQGIVAHMANALRHRGPDDAGVWVDAPSGVAFGHQRLAIQDLSAAGRQPMVSICGRYMFVLNGEIYNHLELREALDCHGPSGPAMTVGWRGHSDTETLLAAIVALGVEETLKRCVGMFAFALWDRETQVLTLARDRFGEKPLYYGWVGQGEFRAFAFASELKALREYPRFNNTINRKALAQYLRLTYVPAPLSIYEGIYKLEPGCLVTLDGSLRPSRGDVKETKWWSFSDLVSTSTNNPIKNETQAITELENCLSQAVQSQCISDVPFGAFLSGGVDSSTIAALMQAQSSTPIKTFTIGFDEQGFDEAPHARAVAKHLGTDHYEMRVTAPIAQDVITQLPQMYDEPFADSSQIPTHLVCRAAREKVTVALSGDAGDEVFGGYNRYFWGPRVWNRVSWLPFAIRKQLGSAINALPISVWDSFSGIAGVSRLGDKAHKLAVRLQTVRDMEELYWSLVSEWQDPGQLVVGLEDRDHEPEKRAWQSGLEAPLSMMFLDTLTYLPDDILCKVDRAAMACGLETRVPFLDHRVVELAWQLPLHMKIRGNTSKWALRQVLYKYVPKELIERPKAGFAIPVGEWLRGPLREWAQALIDPARLRREGYLHSEPIQKVWKEHLMGRRDHTPKLWAVLMFQSWLEQTPQAS
jgi:asparagine synthase (glutamine-hydrolysing)